VIFSRDVFFFPESDEFVAEDSGASADDSPDSPVIYSHVAAPIPESGQFTAGPALPGHRTLSGAPPNSLVCHRLVLFWLNRASPSPFLFLFFWLCF
jgi:hypothetical protein